MMPLLLAALDDRDDDRTHDGSHEEEPDGRSAFHHDPMMPLLESQDARADERDEAEDEKEPRLRRLPPPVLDAIERGAEDAEERPREERLWRLRRAGADPLSRSVAEKRPPLEPATGRHVVTTLTGPAHKLGELLGDGKLAAVVHRVVRAL